MYASLLGTRSTGDFSVCRACVMCRVLLPLMHYIRRVFNVIRHTHKKNLNHWNPIFGILSPTVSTHVLWAAACEQEGNMQTVLNTRHGSMASVLHFPPHVWAIVLRHTPIASLVRLAHVCRALHVLFTSHDVCYCRRADGPFVNCERTEHTRTRAFWTHLRHVRPAPLARKWLSAIIDGHSTYVAFALRAGFAPRSHHPRAYYHCGAVGYIDIDKRLLRNGRVDGNHFHEWAMCAACESGHTAVVAHLLRDGRIDPGYNGQLSIRSASCHGHTDVVKLLLSDQRVDPSVHSQQALAFACCNDQVAVVELLLRDERVVHDTDSIRRFADAFVSCGQRRAIVPLLERALRMVASDEGD